MRYARRSGRYSCIVNGGKIYQVCNTPFLQPPLLESDLVDGVLEDVNSPSVDDSFVQMFPQECGKSDIKKEAVSKRFDLCEWYWNKYRENKSCANIMMHVGKLKASAHCLYLS